MKKGQKMSLESRKKLSVACMGRTAWNKGKKFSLETRKKMSESGKIKVFSEDHKKNLSLAHRGENHWHWKGGISKRYDPIYGSDQTKKYRVWRNEILERDDYKCQHCGSIENLEVDHVKPWKLYPKLRFDIDNGRVLCRACHRKTFISMGNQYKQVQI